MVIDINPNEFDGFISSGLSMVQFTAPWCGPCRMMAPHIEAVSEAYSQVKFGKLNIDKGKNISHRYNITGVPTFIMFSNGNRLDAIRGAQPKSNIIAFIEKYLGTLGEPKETEQEESPQAPPMINLESRSNVMVPRRIPGWSTRRRFR